MSGEDGMDKGMACIHISFGVLLTAGHKHSGFIVFASAVLLNISFDIIKITDFISYFL